MSNKLLTIKEQHTATCELDNEERNWLLSLLNNDNYDSSNPNLLLGLDWNNRSQTRIQAKYFIGLKWIKEGESAVYVKPKISNLDFMTMFMHCFDSDCQDVAAKLGEIYSIDFDSKSIVVNSNCIELTPILIVHFLKLTKGIVQRGLKRNYIQRKENLNSNIKGKIILSETIKRNYSSKRMNRTVCRYQDYSIDCIENRVLKRALIFVMKFININPNISHYQELKYMTSFCLGVMTSVSEEIPLQQMKQFRVNPLYKDYAEALRVAKLILRRFSYNIELIQKDVDRAMPPFWIDMSLLFELYVYSQLKRTYSHQICHHVSTYGNEIDFVKFDEKLIIDAKYIPFWKDKIHHDNVRQLSGYARNIMLRKKILGENKDETTIIDCLVIYPSKDGYLQFCFNEKLVSDKTAIGVYIKFHKLPIKLPIKNIY